MPQYCRLGLDMVCMEDLLDGGPEEPGNGDGQREGRRVPAGLDGVDGLPGDGQCAGELALGQPFGGAALPDVVLHRPGLVPGWVSSLLVTLASSPIHGRVSSELVMQAPGDPWETIGKPRQITVLPAFRVLAGLAWPGPEIAQQGC